MERTLIQRYATGIVKGFFEQADSLQGLDHKPTKGRLRELFVASLLRRYLTSQFGVSNGIVVNQRGDQSRETDVIVYDNRILPPFIMQEQLGVFPIEAVVATVEVKSRATFKELHLAEEAAKQLHDVVASSRGSVYETTTNPPNCSFFGFYDDGVAKLGNKDYGEKWLNDNARHLKSLCIMRHFTWVKLAEDSWKLHVNDEFAEETKTYIGVLVDNVRTLSANNYSALTSKDLNGGHRDWVSLYTRDNDVVKRQFDSPDDNFVVTNHSGQ